MEIITNNQPRHIIYGFELSDKEKEEFDCLDDIDQCSFFRYKGNVYDLQECMRIDGLGNWHGCYSETAFSGVLVRYTADNESVIVGRYYS